MTFQRRFPTLLRIGIPRALLYYHYYPMWKTFFETLGGEVVVSPPTTHTMLLEGSSRVVSDTCLPVKVFIGHVISLVGKCDYVFVPSVRSMRVRVHNCPKFLGLPDMTKVAVPESPPVMDIDIDVNRGREKLLEAVYAAGKILTNDRARMEQAAEIAWEANLHYRRFMSTRRLAPPQAIERLSGSDPAPDQKWQVGGNQARATIAIIGHPYLTHDEIISHRIIQRLERAGCRVVTPEMVLAEELESAVARTVGTSYWTFEDEVTGAGEYFLNNGVDGVISVVAFACGPDSLMMEVVQQRARSSPVPYMNLALDEHTGEAGMITRLEAFLDMVMRKKRRPSCASA